MRLEGGLISLSEENHSRKHVQSVPVTLPLYHDIPPEDYSSSSSQNTFSPFTSITPRLGINLPNPAPEVEMLPNQMQLELSSAAQIHGLESHTVEPTKKKYAKEAWPGKKPIPTLLV